MQKGPPLLQVLQQHPGWERAPCPFGVTRQDQLSQGTQICLASLHTLGAPPLEQLPEEGWDPQPGDSPPSWQARLDRLA